MKIKAEVFKAIDKVDGMESCFIIYSVDGEDIEYNCVPDVGSLGDQMVRESKNGDYIRWTDNENEPRRDDMIEPELIEVFYLDK